MIEAMARDLNINLAADPRKRTTGTSYSTTGKGAVPVDPKAKVEVGSARTSQIREIVPALASRQAAQAIYSQMSKNDAAVDVSLRAGKMPIVGADFFIEAYDSKPENQEIAEFVNFNLLRSQSAPFLSVLQDALRMMEDGFSVGEKVFEEREWSPSRNMANRRVYTMLKKISPRLAPSIRSINYDDSGGPVGVTHIALNAENKPTEVDIPISKLVIFSHNKRGGNLEGTSILRTAYKHWYYKENLYKIDGIQKERHGMGFPLLELPPTANSADIKVGLELISNIRTNERAGAVLPTGWNLRFADMPGQPVNIMGSIDHHNGMIMMNIMVQFLLMGISEGGGRATAGAHQDMFTKSLRYMANLICDMFNLYVIPQLVAYNFPTDSFPEMRVRNIGETKDLQQWAAAMANLAGQNLITLDVDTENWVRSKIDAPLKIGGVQTPEANAGNASEKKGNIEAGKTETGNTGVPTDQAGT